MKSETARISHEQLTMKEKIKVFWIYFKYFVCVYIYIYIYIYILYYIILYYIILYYIIYIYHSTVHCYITGVHHFNL